MAHSAMSIVQMHWNWIVQESTLPLDAACGPVHAWKFNHANTIFQVSTIICDHAAQVLDFIPVLM